MKQLLLAIRIKDWWNAIIIPVISFYLIGLHYSDYPIDIDSVLNSFSILFLSATTAAFGFYLNELTDIQDDIRAGKNNIVATFSTSKASLIFRLIIFFTAISTVLFWEYTYILVLFSIQIILFILYSCPPVRLKRFPIAAVILDSLYSGTIFYFICLLYAEANLNWTIALLTLGFGIFRGLRNIIYHVDKDQKLDHLAGQKTLAHLTDNHRMTLAQSLLFFLEISCLLCLLFPVSAYSFYIVITGVLILLVKRNYYRFYSSGDISDKKKWLSEINTVYEVWLPVAMVAGTFGIWEWRGFLAGYLVMLILFPGISRIIHEIYLLLLNIYYLGYKFFYFISDLYFIHTKPHFDIGKWWKRLTGNNEHS